MERWSVGEVEVTRLVDFQIGLPAGGPVPGWLEGGGFLDADGGVLLASSAFALRAGDRRVVVDPWLAFDADRADPAAAAAPCARLLGDLDAAGFPPGEVDVVVNTHVDGVGHNVAPAPGGAPTGWAPAFPSARYRYSRTELADWDGDAGLAPLVGGGVVDPLDPPEEVAPGVTVEAAPGHSDGHTVVRVRSRGEELVLAGHLFISPMQVADPATGLDADVALAGEERRRLLAGLAERGGSLYAPLMGGPGGGRVVADGHTWRLDPG